MFKNERIAVVLFNLGGPDNPEAIKPFLYNLFADPAIIQIPAPFRQILAKIISAKRAPIAEKIYEEIGGKSPILEETKKQEKALEKKLSKFGDYKVFTVMRYWHPFSKQVAQNVKNYNPTKIILLPLYPQFSTTTSASSFKDWYKAAKSVGLNTQTTSCCCYGNHEKFIEAHTQTIKPILLKAQKNGPVRVLFSAHGLPQKIVDKGDPYATQVYDTANKTTLKLEAELGIEQLDQRVCFQSRVGPLKWLSPSLDEEIDNAIADSVGIVVVPIAFVSEHSETLVELDIEYKHLAIDKKIKQYVRVPTLSTNKMFINCLSDIVLSAVTKNQTKTCGNAICLCEKSGGANVCMNF